MAHQNITSLVEPYKINSVENICFNNHEKRLEILKRTDFNPFRLSHEDVIIDLLTDSGTNSISAVQRSNAFLADETYAGASSFKKIETNTEHLTGFKHVLPFHQKRLCEQILCQALVEAGNSVVSNTFTHTMEAYLKSFDAIPVSFVTTDPKGPFTGNIDMEKFRQFVLEKEENDKISFVVLNIPSKVLGGLPVSLENIKEVTSFCKKHSILVIIETSMYAENSWFIKNYESGHSERQLTNIAHDMFSHFDGCIISFSRDGSNLIGSVFASNDIGLIQKLQPLLILKGGFTSYGGIAGRFMETIATGMFDAFNEANMDFRFKQLRMIGDILKENGVPIIEPIGCNTIFIDVDSIKWNFSAPLRYPAWSLICAAYVHGGVRGAEYGQLTGWNSSLPTDHVLAKKELIKLEIPRRTYSNCHYLYMARVFGELIAKNNQYVSGMRLLDSSPTGGLAYLKLKLEPFNPEKLKKHDLNFKSKI